MTRSAPFLALALLLAGCSTSAPRGESQARDRNVITVQEIEAISALDAYDAIRQLRPEFLRTRGAVSVRSAQGQFPVVYVSGVRYGELNQLRSIRTTDILSIRFVNAADATTRWGTGHAGGVIEVTLRS